MLRAISVLVAAALQGRLTRFEIAEDSMEPTLHAGEWVLGIRRPRRVAPGTVVVVDHPHRPGFQLAKRVATVAGDAVMVLGDDAARSVDSRHFGPVPATGVVARLVLVYHPRWRPVR